MRTLALGLFLCSAATAHAQTATPLSTQISTRIAALLADPAVSRAHWGIAVTTLDGKLLYGHEEGKLFRPASNNKIFTTAAAMALLGPSRALTTVATLTATADPQGNVEGDIVLTGAGDGTFASALFPYVEPLERSAAVAARPGLADLDQLAAGIAAAGIKHVSGNVIGDDTLWPFEPYATGWELDDLVWGYGAPVSALTVADNQLVVTVSPGAVPGALPGVTIAPDTGYYQVQMDATTVAANAPAGLDFERAPGSHLLRIAGTVALRKPDREEVAIDDPAEFAAQAFQKSLAAHGVTVDGRATAHHRPASAGTDFLQQSRAPLPGLPAAVPGVLAATPSLLTAIPTAAEKAAVCTSVCPVRVEHAGPALAGDIKLILKVSQNLHTELLLHALGKRYGADGSTAQGVRVVRQFLVDAGVDPADFIFYDGSGLSSHDLVTPHGMVTFLGWAAKQPWFAAWKASLPEAGVDGGLDTRFPQPGLKHHLFAKTGTLGESRALSGYLDTAGGSTVIFSILVDTHAPGSSADRVTMDKIAAAIAAAH